MAAADHDCGEPGRPVDVALCGDCWDTADEQHAARVHARADAAMDRLAARIGLDVGESRTIDVTGAPSLLARFGPRMTMTRTQ